VVQNSYQLGEGASDAIAKALRLVAGARYQPGAVSAGLSDARDELVEQGYRDAKITVTGRQLPDNRVDVCIHVDRGPKLLVGSVTITGNQAVPSADLLALVTAKQGEPLADLVLERDVLKLQALYFDRGFLKSTISSPEIRVVDGALSVGITVSEGPVFTIGSIGVKGDLVTTKAAYQRRLSVKPGDVFNRSKVMADMERIRALHREQNAPDVDIEPETTLDPSKKRVDLVLRIRAKTAP
jgi:outer membrane protein insertion porin family